MQTTRLAPKASRALKLIVASAGVGLLCAVGFAQAMGSADPAEPRTHEDERGEPSTPVASHPSIADLESATEQAIACMKEAGLTVEVRPRSGLRPTEYSVTAPAEDSMRAAILVERDCALRFRERVAAQYYDTMLLGEPGGEAARALTACLRRAGTTVPDLESMSDVNAWVFQLFWRGGQPETEGQQALIRTYFPCKESVSAATGVPLP